MSKKAELNMNELENVTGGYIGYTYDSVTGIGTCGLGENRDYDITDYKAFAQGLLDTEGQSDVSRMKYFRDTLKCIKKR